MLSLSISCWFGNLDVKYRNALNRIVINSGKIIGTEQRSLPILFNKNVLNRAQSVLLDSDNSSWTQSSLFCLLTFTIDTNDEEELIQIFVCSLCSHIILIEFEFLKKIYLWAFMCCVNLFLFLQLLFILYIMLHPNCP